MRYAKTIDDLDLKHAEDEALIAAIASDIRCDRIFCESKADEMLKVTIRRCLL